VFVLAMGATAWVQPGDGVAAWIARGVVLATYLGVIAATYRSDARTSL